MSVKLENGYTNEEKNLKMKPTKGFMCKDENGTAVFARSEGRRLSKKEILEYFSKFGKVTRVQMPKIQYHRYYFIFYESAKGVDKVFKQHHENGKVDGCKITIEKFRQKYNRKINRPPKVYYCTHCGERNVIRTSYTRGRYKYRYQY